MSRRSAQRGDGRDETLGKAYDSRMMRRLWQYVRPHRSWVALGLLLVFVVSAVQLTQPYIVKVAIDDYIAEGQIEGLWQPALLFLVTLILEFVLRFAQIYVLERTGQSVIFDIRRELFAHLQRLPSSFLRAE